MDVPVRSQLHGIQTFLVEAKNGFGTAKNCHGSIASDQAGPPDVEGEGAGLRGGTHHSDLRDACWIKNRCAADNFVAEAGAQCRQGSRKLCQSFSVEAKVTWSFRLSKRSWLRKLSLNCLF